MLQSRGRSRHFEEPVRRDSTNCRGVVASAGRINLVEGKRDAFELNLTGDVRHDSAGLDGVHRATAAPDGSSASGRDGTGNPLEKIANIVWPRATPGGDDSLIYINDNEATPSYSKLYQRKLGNVEITNSALGRRTAEDGGRVVGRGQRGAMARFQSIAAALLAAPPLTLCA